MDRLRRRVVRSPGFLGRIPGPASLGSRLDLVRALGFLIGDFPITGGGLDGFPGGLALSVLRDCVGRRGNRKCERRREARQCPG